MQAAEIVLILAGILTLIRGRFTWSKKKVVYGTQARVLAIITFLPIPTSLLIATIVAAVLVALGHSVTTESFRWIGAGIEGGVLIFYMILLYVLSNRFAAPSE